jgi:hypothetical protein
MGFDRVDPDNVVDAMPLDRPQRLKNRGARCSGLLDLARSEKLQPNLPPGPTSASRAIPD